MQEQSSSRRAALHLPAWSLKSLPRRFGLRSNTSFTGCGA
jgi:hypothetical protein